MGNSDHPNHPALARRLQAYLRWRNANARHPDVLAAQRRERARIRSERQQRWGRPRAKAALFVPVTSRRAIRSNRRNSADRIPRWKGGPRIKTIVLVHGFWWT